MEVSSEFIDMAAHLVQMKSALLLPRSPEAERMKAELTGAPDRVQRLQGGGRPAGQPRQRPVHRSARSRCRWSGAAEYTRRHDPNLLVQRLVQPDGPQPAQAQTHAGAF